MINNVSNNNNNNNNNSYDNNNNNNDNMEDEEIDRLQQQEEKFSMSQHIEDSNLAILTESYTNIEDNNNNVQDDETDICLRKALNFTIEFDKLQGNNSPVLLKSADTLYDSLITQQKEKKIIPFIEYKNNALKIMSVRSETIPTNYYLIEFNINNNGKLHCNCAYFVNHEKNYVCCKHILIVKKSYYLYNFTI